MSLLVTSGLRKSFGGLEAVAGVDFSLEKGEVRAIIGPNGAGKTTFVSLIAGRARPDSGTISFEGEDITTCPDFKRVRKGIAYTFQITSIFQNLSVNDNVALAAGSHLNDTARGAIARMGLADRGEQIAGTLAYGHQRLLEVAMGLALKPKLLILDEPTQGLSDGEITNFMERIRDVSSATTILLIEHNMHVVMELAKRVTVMDRGRILAEGTPDEIRADAAVQQAYLGSG